MIKKRQSNSETHSKAIFQVRRGRFSDFSHPRRLSWTKAVTLEQVVDSSKLAKSSYVLHVVLSHNNWRVKFFTNQVPLAKLELYTLVETQSQ